LPNPLRKVSIASSFEKGDFAGALKEIEQVGAASEEVLRLLDSLGQEAP
jgi:hypothetical protein